MKPLYVSATLQDCGKTSVTLGLLQVLKSRNLEPGYIKPVGQRYVQFHGENLDEDAVLVYEFMGYDDRPKDLSPIAIERGFTRDFIFEPNVMPLEKQILDSTSRLRSAHKTLLIEGTGHAGVGSCFGLSNARVAELTNSNVVIVTSGGIGRPMDEVAVSLSLFRYHKVNVLGVILNKIMPDKYDKIRNTVSRGLQNLGTRLLGAIPFETTLKNYTLGQVAEAFDYDVLCNGRFLSNKIENVVVAAMEPQNAINHIQRRSLIITPGDRIDNILLALAMARTADYHERICTGGVILTGGLIPEETILNLLKSSDIPVLVTNEDTYLVTARMKDLAFKIQYSDTDKIRMTHHLVEKYVDVEYLISCLEA